MTVRTFSTRARRFAALAAVASLLLAAAPARAASAVDIEVRALVAGRYEIGGWLALSVTLVNPGAPTDGYLSAETDGGVVRRFVEMPAGARKVVALYVEPEAFQREVSVTYTEPNGSVTAEAEIRVLEQISSQVAIVGDANGTLRPQIVASAQVRPDPLSLQVADMPERPEPLAGLSAIVWAADSTALTTGQLASLERWTAEGGKLVVVGGADWQTRTAGVAELLPLSGLASADGASLASLAAFAGQPADGLEPATVAHGTLRDGARAIVTADDGTILASMRAFGAGEVVLIGPDLAVEAFRGWAGAATLWDRLIPSSAVFDQFFGGGGMRDEVLSAMNGALGTLPTLQVPPVELLLAVIVGYILLIGPISYLVLRRVDRRELAWVTAPVLIVLFSACSYGIGRSIKGSDVVVNQVSIVRTTPTGAALAQTFAGVFSPDRATYDLSVDADALLGALDSTSFDGIPRATGSVVVEQGQPAHLRDLTISAFGFAGVEASGLVEAEPALVVTWESRDGALVGTVTNASDATVDDVAYISSSGGKRLGELAAGASVEFRPSADNFSGSSASDQVYGFGGFNDGTDEQRLVSLRRQVIDALVGYGGWAGVDMGAAYGRGPYVVGWRTDEGPMPVTVEDTTARRHTAVVEVVPAAPSIGSGEVRIRPYQMSTTLTDTEGDIGGGFDMGTVIINDGSATFSIGLPLAATGLVPTEIDIVVGPDPTVVLGNPGDFVGFWPAGFMLEVRDVTTGEWVVLGGLNESSSFAVDDPSRVLGPTGLIEVRVSGTTDPNFGQPGVFVSAAVEGVIGR